MAVNVRPPNPIRLPGLASPLRLSVAGLGRPPTEKVDDTYRLLVTVKEIVDARIFTGVWRGGILKCLAFPSTANLTPGDVVVVTRLNESEYFYWEAVAGEMIYFAMRAVSGNVQSALWRYDGMNSPVIVYTTTLGNSDYSVTAITQVFRHPGDGKIYFTTFTEDQDAYNDETWYYLEEIHLLVFDPATGLTTDTGMTFDNLDLGWGTISPPMGSVAYFQGQIYLGQSGEDGYDPDLFSERVYRFDYSVPSVVTVFTHPSTNHASHYPQGLAVFGADIELHFGATVGGGGGDGRIFKTTDGDDWSTLQDLGDSCWITDLMTDKSDGSIYAALYPATGDPEIWRYDGATYAFDFAMTSLDPIGALATQYNGVTRTNLWALHSATLYGYQRPDSARKNGGSWTEENTGPQPPSTWTDGGLNYNQSGASIRNELCRIVATSSIELWRRIAGTWTLVYTFSQSLSGRDFHVMCLAKVGILPHEQ